MQSDPASRIQAIIDKYAKEHIGVVVGLISPDYPYPSAKLLFAGADTLWNTAQQPLTLDGSTPFEIGSITKVFTSLVQYNQQSSSPYGGTLGEFITAGSLPQSLSSLPILDLANYSPGFPTDNQGGWWPRGAAQSLPALIDYLSKSSGIPQYTPGTCYTYSNFGWSLLAMASLGVSSKTEDIASLWATAISTIVQDLDMSSSTAPYDPSMDASLPVGYDKSGTIFPIGRSYQPTPPMIFGAGNLVSTGSDMYLWLAYNMGLGNPANFNIQTLQQATTYNYPQCGSTKTPPVVSLGWFHHTATINGQSVTWLAKDGGVGGFTSWMGFEAWVDASNPSPSPIGAFVLTNSHGALSLGQRIIQILLGATDPTASDLEPAYVPEP